MPRSGSVHRISVDWFGDKCQCNAFRCSGGRATRGKGFMEAQRYPGYCRLGFLGVTGLAILVKCT
jgi:hypothetical protein